MLGCKLPDTKGHDAAQPAPIKASSEIAAFRLTVIFMLTVILAFLGVEGWRTWRDYHSAFSSARNSVTNLARATAQHAEDAIRQVDVLTAALGERVEGDGLQNINVPRIHKLLVQQAKLMPQLHGLFIYGPDGQWIVTDKEIIPDPANNERSSDRVIWPCAMAARSFPCCCPTPIFEGRRLWLRTYFKPFDPWRSSTRRIRWVTSLPVQALQWPSLQTSTSPPPP